MWDRFATYWRVLINSFDVGRQFGNSISFPEFLFAKIADLDLKMYTVLTYVDSYLYRMYT